MRKNARKISSKTHKRKSAEKKSSVKYEIEKDDKCWGGKIKQERGNQTSSVGAVEDEANTATTLFDARSTRYMER